VVAGLICLTSNGLAAAEFHFPGEQWESASAGEAGWDEQKLEEAIDFAMSRKSSSVVVVHAGRIIAERHSEMPKASARYSAMKLGMTSEGHAIEDVASVQKSIVCLLVGVAIDQGLVTLDDSVQKHLSVGWSKADKELEPAITLRHLVTMTSGLNTKLEFVAAPGTRWAYNTNAYAKSLTCLEAVTGKSANELTSDWLLQQINMKDSKWAERLWLADSGADANRYGFATSARDLARFGVLALAGGNWQDQSLVSREYLRSALSPSQKLNLSYGYLWWLNGQASGVRGGRKASGPLIASAPSDLVAALGALGRKCYVVASLDLVVVRLGDDPDRPGQKKFENEFWRRLMLARKL
jgi:CubicO group peptidase (beta-lactamase class C family)